MNSLQNIENHSPDLLIQFKRASETGGDLVYLNEKTGELKFVEKNKSWFVRYREKQNNAKLGFTLLSRDQVADRVLQIAQKIVCPNRGEKEETEKHNNDIKSSLEILKKLNKRLLGGKWNSFFGGSTNIKISKALNAAIFALNFKIVNLSQSSQVQPEAAPVSLITDESVSLAVPSSNPSQSNISLVTSSSYALSIAGSTVLSESSAVSSPNPSESVVSLPTSTSTTGLSTRSSGALDSSSSSNLAFVRSQSQLSLFDTYNNNLENKDKLQEVDREYFEKRLKSPGNEHYFVVARDVITIRNLIIRFELDQTEARAFQNLIFQADRQKTDYSKIAESIVRERNINKLKNHDFIVDISQRLNIPEELLDKAYPDLKICFSDILHEPSRDKFNEAINSNLIEYVYRLNSSIEKEIATIFCKELGLKESVAKGFCAKRNQSMIDTIIEYFVPKLIDDYGFIHIKSALDFKNKLKDSIILLNLNVYRPYDPKNKTLLSIENSENIKSVAKSINAQFYISAQEYFEGLVKNNNEEIKNAIIKAGYDFSTYEITYKGNPFQTPFLKIATILDPTFTDKTIQRLNDIDSLNSNRSSSSAPLTSVNSTITSSASGLVTPSSETASATNLSAASVDPSMVDSEAVFREIAKDWLDRNGDKYLFNTNDKNMYETRAIKMLKVNAQGKSSELICKEAADYRAENKYKYKNLATKYNLSENDVKIFKLLSQRFPDQNESQIVSNIRKNKELIKDFNRFRENEKISQRNKEIKGQISNISRQLKIDEYKGNDFEGFIDHIVSKLVFKGDEKKVRENLKNIFFSSTGVDKILPAIIICLNVYFIKRFKSKNKVHSEDFLNKYEIHSIIQDKVLLNYKNLIKEYSVFKKLKLSESDYLVVSSGVYPGEYMDKSSVQKNILGIAPKKKKIKTCIIKDIPDMETKPFPVGRILAVIKK